VINAVPLSAPFDDKSTAEDDHLVTSGVDVRFGNDEEDLFDPVTGSEVVVADDSSVPDTLEASNPMKRSFRSWQFIPSLFLVVSLHSRNAPLF
jgi:hypothetical protein